jgi:hypothetical protein
MSSATAWIGVVIGAAGLAFGLYQFHVNSNNAERARLRERAVKAVDEMRQFLDDEDVRRVLKIIDYGEVTLHFPSMPQGHEVEVTSQLLRQSLAHHNKPETSEPQSDWTKTNLFSADQQRIRDVSDNFFGRLERIENLIRNDVVSKEDFGELFSYWLELMGERALQGDELVHFGNQRRQRLWNYIRAYRFDGVVRLFEMYGRAGPVGTDSFVARKALRPDELVDTSLA